jgi:hypothetical protein
MEWRLFRTATKEHRKLKDERKLKLSGSCLVLDNCLAGMNQHRSTPGPRGTATRGVHKNRSRFLVE